MQIFKKSEPTSALDQLTAGVEKLTADLAANGAERDRLKADLAQRTAARALAHADLSGIINNATRFAATPAAELEAAKRSLVGSAEAATQAEAALGAHVVAHGDLIAQARRLRLEEGYLAQENFRDTDHSYVGEIVRLGTELKSVLADRELNLQAAITRLPEPEALPDGRQIEKFAGLIDIGFPGIFDVEAHPAYSGENLRVRNIWDHHVMHQIAKAHPDLVEPAVLERVASDKARGRMPLIAPPRILGA